MRTGKNTRVHGGAGYLKAKGRLGLHGLNAIRLWAIISAWFKNARFRVTLGISARTLIGPALERVYASPLAAVLGVQFRENRVYPRSSSQ